MGREMKPKRVLLLAPSLLSKPPRVGIIYDDENGCEQRKIVSSLVRNKMKVLCPYFYTLGPEYKFLLPEGQNTKET